jgi:hypothetical protein
MEESNALHKLTEAADLIRMVEELTSPAAFEKLSPSTLAGMRITLRNIRETILNSHDTMAEQLVTRARISTENRPIVPPPPPPASYVKPQTNIITPETGKIDSVNLLDNATATRSSGAAFTRRDLRASLEKLADR